MKFLRQVLNEHKVFVHAEIVFNGDNKQFYLYPFMIDINQLPFDIYHNLYNISKLCRFYRRALNYNNCLKYARKILDYGKLSEFDKQVIDNVKF